MGKRIIFYALLIFSLSSILALSGTYFEKDSLTKEIVSEETIIKIYEKSPQIEEVIINEGEGTVEYAGIKSQIIVDELQFPREENPTLIQKEIPSEDSPLEDSQTFIHKPYYDNNGTVALDIYIEDTFYYANQAALDDFWDKFFPRFQKLKERTDWSSLRWFGVPLEIYNYGHSAACYGGNASPTHSNVVFSDPMYKVGCHKPYYENGSTHYNNPGELGDWWPYMNTALHEATHSIMPYPIYTRSWLTEGWAEYEMYNTLTETVSGNSLPDINQETADTYLHNGFAGYQWDPYVANDFHDTTIYNRELQRSHGYDITGHMFSKMVYEEGMDWKTFYKIINNNKDSLDRTFSLGPPYIYFTDAFVINIFGKAMGHTNYWTQTDPLFNYYSTPSHGYGARNISNSNMSIPMPYSDFDWFADFTPTIQLSNDTPKFGENVEVIATIYNNGDVNAKNISVKIYYNEEIIYEEYLDINKNQNIQIPVNFTALYGEKTLKVVVDEDYLKVETNDSNNIAEQIVSIPYETNCPQSYFDKDTNQWIFSPCN